MALLVQSGKVDAQRLGHLVVLDDDQIVLERCLIGISSGLASPFRILTAISPASVAQVLIVDGEGEQAAGHAHALLAGYGELIFLADLADLRSARGDA